MKAAIAVAAAALFSLAGCRSHKAVERTSTEETTVIAADTANFSHRTLTESGSDASMVAIEFFPPDTAGRQAVRKIALARRTTTATTATTDTASRIAGRQEQRSTASTAATTPLRPCRWALIAALGTAMTLILLTLYKIKRQ